MIHFSKKYIITTHINAMFSDYFFAFFAPPGFTMFAP